MSVCLQKDNDARRLSEEPSSALITGLGQETGRDNITSEEPQPSPAADHGHPAVTWEVMYRMEDHTSGAHRTEDHTSCAQTGPTFLYPLKILYPNKFTKTAAHLSSL